MSVDSAPTPAEAQADEPSMMGSLLENPLVPIGFLAALLLLGFGAFRLSKGRKSNLNGDSSFLESRIQQDSFFGASGGQRIDTSNSDLNTGSSMAYSPSQLDAGGDVDPVAEADVYLAYNRDLQAEEILKEAIRHTPGRISAHVKLAEIYAKRQDRAAFEVVAGEVFKLTQGEGSDWQRIMDLGGALDPANPLYQPGGQPVAPAPTEPAPLEGGFPTFAALGNVDSDNNSDLDLDLDLNLHDDALTEAPPSPEITTSTSEKPADFLDTPPSSMDDNNLDAIDLDLPVEDLTAPSSGPTPLVDEATTKSDALEFDLGGLSLDLDVPSAHGEISKLPAEDRNLMPDDPLATKLALAEEFKTIGDIEGARTYFEEVIAEASGELKEKAQKLLAELG
jgi:pilus assembly protein FimV